MIVINIGDFAIVEMLNDKIWISKTKGPDEGEGMEISFSLLNEMFYKLFKEHM